MEATGLFCFLKGAKSLKVFVPVKATYLILDNNKEIPLSQANKEQKEAYKAGKIDSKTRLHFKLGNVFDISQTNFPIENYPKMFHMGYSSEHHKLINKGLIDYCQEKLHCPVETENLGSIVLRGTYDPYSNIINLNEKMQDTQVLSTLTHEMGHALLHKDSCKGKSLNQIELEADAVSVMLQSSFDLSLTDTRKSHLADHYKAFVKECRNVNPEKKHGSGKKIK